MNRAYSPYENLPPRAFWRTGVAGQDPHAIADLYRPKFPIARTTPIAIAGTCFAQHVTQHLRERGFAIVDTEPPPRALAGDAGARFGFGLASARHGNIYTARQLRQLFEEAHGAFTPADAVWEKDGRFFDAMRPAVEPDGLPSPDAVREHRAAHLERVRAILRSADVFVFVLGLTEAWTHRGSRTVYPSAPGTLAGAFDPAVHAFHNLTFAEVYADLTAFMALAKRENQAMTFVLAVSPVPLTATASGEHVLTATTYSKSVLRAVAGQLAMERDDVDYFPLYEIVTSALSKGAFFDPNLRTVTVEGLSAAMDAFFSAHGAGERPAPPKTAARRRTTADIACDAVVLDAFAE